MFPFLIFVSLASFFSAILNSHNKFAIASAVPIILNLLLIAVLILGKILNDQLVYYLSYAVTISGILQFVFLYFFTKKYFSPKINLSFKIDNKVKLFFRKLLPSIFSSGVTQINILIGTIIASFQASAVRKLVNISPRPWRLCGEASSADYTRLEARVHSHNLSSRSAG